MRLSDGSTQVNRYDAEGLRHEMEENGRLVQFLFSGRDVAAETKEDGEIIRYIRGYRLVSSDSEHAKTYYHYASDEMGSITHVADVTGGQVCNEYRYDAFGNTVYESEQVRNRFRYTGQQYDGVTGQYYLRARYYNPVLGRFTQEDTYYGDGLNLYVYCANHPVGYWDPSGNACEQDVHNKDGRDKSSYGADDPQVQAFIEKFKEKFPDREFQSGHLKQHSDGRVLEIDFETDNVIIEFKEGNGKGLTRQVGDRMDVEINPDGKVVIGVTGKPTSGHVQIGVENIGGLTTSDIGLLLEVIKP